MPYESHSDMADRLADALARLQRARDENAQLVADLARVTEERDAAKADMLYALKNSDSFTACDPCLHHGRDDCMMNCKFESCHPEWRGPCAENGGTNAEN